jgi:hypothetical protein
VAREGRKEDIRGAGGVRGTAFTAEQLVLKVQGGLRKSIPDGPICVNG